MLNYIRKHGVAFASLFTAVALIFIAFAAITGTEQKKVKNNLTVLEQATRKAAVQCYIVEGFYPPDVKYLEDKYGLIVDSKKYLIYYEAFASNIMPRIEVYLADNGNSVT